MWCPRHDASADEEARLLQGKEEGIGLRCSVDEVVSVPTLG
jgi:hypothetical protein